MQTHRQHILYAIADGKPVEYRIKLTSDPLYWSAWFTVTSDERAYVFTNDYEWRVKADPIKVGLVAYRTDNLYSSDIGCEIRKPRMGEAPNIWLFFDDEGKLVTATLPEEELS